MDKSLDLYCDHPNHIHESNHRLDSDQFFSDEGNPKTDAFKIAMKFGWKINLKERTCICPKCNKK